MNKTLPLLMLILGGTMIVAGINKQNPLTVIKNVLTGVPMPGAPVSAPPKNNPQSQSGAGINRQFN